MIAAEKVAVGRIRLRPDPARDEPFGQLRGRPVVVIAEDGVPLHAEVSGREDAPVTIVFCHGYTLSQEVWHYQRRTWHRTPAWCSGTSAATAGPGAATRPASASSSSAATSRPCWP